MVSKRTLVACGIATALGLGSTAASAAGVTSWDLGDFNDDGLMSDFAFFSAPAGNSANAFAPFGETCGAGACVPIAMDTGEIGPDVFTTGFNFGGTGDFKPQVTDGSGTGNIAADITGGALSFSALDFAGSFPGTGGTLFTLPPDGGANNVTVETLTDLGGGDWGVVVRYVGTINDPGGSFHNFAANWRLEGIMSTGSAPPPEVPIPAAAWLFGSGLVGLVGVARRRRRKVS
jgi:hypothetical protein